MKEADLVTEAHVRPLKARRDLGARASQGLGLLLVLVVLVWLGVNLVKSPDNFGRVLLIGVSQGALYALVALGYTLVYGILELINFAHGDVFMLGGMFSASMLLSVFHLSGHSSTGSLIAAILISLFVAMAACGILNASIEFVAYRPLRGAPRLAPLITAIGMSFILQDVGLNRLGPAPVSVPNVLPTGAVHRMSVTTVAEPASLSLLAIGVLAGVGRQLLSRRRAV